jgi:hypothetical protein
MSRSIVATGLLLFATASVRAQFGNETIFVGRTGTPTYTFVDTGTGAVFNGSDNRARNVRGAVFADDGKNLYVANAAPVFSISGISRCEWDGTTATWSAFYTVPDASYFLGLDRARKLLWVLTGNPTGGRQLHCVNADPDSAAYGTLLGQTSLAPITRERWALSASGNLAAVPPSFAATNQFDIVDTDPTSATFLQVVVSVPISSTSPGSGPIMACWVSDDDQYAYLTVPGAAPYVGVLHIPTQTWLDFDANAAGQQHFLLPSLTPNFMVVSPDASYAIVTGGATGLGWVQRIDFDYANPGLTQISDCVPGVQMFGTGGPSVSFDNTRFAFTANGLLYVVDAQTGAVLLTAAGSGIATAWQDPRITARYAPFGAGCTGSLGVPTLAAATTSPWPLLGSPFTLNIGQLPFGLALVGFGFSNTNYNGLPLPLPLDAIGMPTCTLLAAPELLDLVVGTQTATWSVTLPATASLAGLEFFNQAFSLDPATNSLGLVASNAGRGVIGF